jgi:hypothetical protein
MSINDIIGMSGVGSYLIGYALLQLGILGPHDGRFATLNTIGGVLMLYSLYWDFNLASFVSQFFWLFLTAVGWVRTVRARRAAAPVPVPAEA